MYLLDTNVVSELRRPERADPRVLAWARATDHTTFFLSTITIFEIELGILRIERRDQAQGAVLRQWLEHRVLPAFAGRVFPVDLAVARRCACLHVPDPQSERDALITATALVHQLKVVTRNVADFKPMGVPIINPWLDASP